MMIYAIIITAVALMLAIKYLFLKKAMKAVCLFAKENYRAPTKEEISNYSNKVVAETFKHK